MIRHAEKGERRKLHDWLLQSHHETRALNLPEYPMEDILSWQEFLSQFEDYYYMKEGRKFGSIMVISQGEEELGCVCYSAACLKRRTVEMSVWLKSASLYGKGIEVQAIRDTTLYLNRELGFRFFLSFPPEVDLLSIRIFKEAGFTYRTDKEDAIKRHFRLEAVEKLLEEPPEVLEKGAILTLEIPLPT